MRKNIYIQNRNTKLQFIKRKGKANQLKQPDLHGIEKQLMFKLLQAEDLLEHVEELFLGHDELAVQALLHPAWAFALLLPCGTTGKVIREFYGRLIVKQGICIQNSV